MYVNPMATSYATRLADVDLETAERRVALKEMEQHFVFNLLREMRKTVSKSGLLDGGFAMEMHEQMLDEVLSAEIAETGQFGVARMLEEQLRAAEIRDELGASPAGAQGMR
jgi:flagellar protein FlgJ